jgi:predicted ester cyclase
MDTDKNKLIVRRWQEAYNSGNLEALDELLAPDWRSNSWPEELLPKSVENAKALHLMTLQIFPDWHHTTEDVIAEGDRVVQRFTFTGTHVSEFFGLMPTGKRFEGGGINIFRIDAGRIVEHWAFVEELGYLAQLGADLSAAWVGPVVHRQRLGSAPSNDRAPVPA